MKGLREAARRALAGSSGALGEVHRITADVEVEGRTEVVTLLLGGDGQLRWTSTGGEGPHVEVALRFVAGLPVEGQVVARAESAPKNEGPPARTETSGLSPIGQGEEASDPGTSAAEALAEVLEVLVTAVVRTGVEQADRGP
ncbi:MAG: hypothetical protein KC416_16305, partial [Myxococcales bacterium]|nr:hypothetical protein [Myxococcales bacterium]